MPASGKHRTTSGVEIAAEFRDNLIIDRYDPVFAGMRGKKLEHMRSENSEDAITWNVFRSLRQIRSEAWLPNFFQHAFPAAKDQALDHAVVDLWKTIAPPISLLLQFAEGDSEIDVIIETQSFVWIIEAKLKSDISMTTTHGSERNQVLRNIDVGSYYAGVRPFYFSLLVTDEKKSPKGAKKILEYQNLQIPRELLASHRPDGLLNLKGVSLVTWKDLGRILEGVVGNESVCTEEGGYAERALKWLYAKGFIG